MSEPSTRPRIKSRIENLSDLVFGLALSIGSIVLISRLPQTPAQLVTGIALFGFSFLLVAWIWYSYTLTITSLPYEVRGTILLNIALLFCVAIEPYLFYVTTEGPTALVPFASSVYGLEVAALDFLLAGLVLVLLGEDRKRDSLSSGVPAGLLRVFRRSVVALVGAGVVFSVSSLPFAWVPGPFGQSLRFYAWDVALVLLFVYPRL